MAGIDPQIFFSYGREVYLDALEFSPRNVEVLEIYQFEVESIFSSALSF